jgi:AmiR/NasT family two-component response regulator
LAREPGARLILVARREDRLRALAEVLPCEATYVAADLTDVDAPEKVRAHVAEQGERLTLLVVGRDLPAVGPQAAMAHLLEVLDRARRILLERAVPILLLTAYTDAKLVRRAAEAGVFAYLVKPFDANELVPAIETAVARHEELVALRDQVATLADALAARKSIERAKGLLMEHEGMTEGEAFARLRRASQVSGQSLKVIADAITVALG